MTGSTFGRVVLWTMLGATALCLAGALALGIRMASLRRSGGADSSPATVPKSGEQVVAVFIGASFCGWSRDRRLRSEISQMRKVLEVRARKEGATFMTIGVALDGAADAGLRFLRRFGRFGETAVGAGWLNSEAVRYMWRDVPGDAAIPQVVVLERPITVTGSGIDVGEEHMLVRAVGTVSIARWARAGFPYSVSR